MNTLPWSSLLLAASIAVTAAGYDPTRDALPPPSPKRGEVPGKVLFRDDFRDAKLERWRPDREGVWRVRGGMLKAELPDGKQERSFLFTGSPTWTDYAVEVDLCAMRGVDKGVVVRVEGESGIAVDLRGPGYQDVLLQRREWPLGKARAHNANATWHRLRVEARGHRYRVWVNGELAIDRMDRRKARGQGGIALAAYTGGVGECTVYYDNVVVIALASLASDDEPIGDAEP